MKKFDCCKMFAALLLIIFLAGATRMEKTKANLVGIQKINPHIRLDLKYATDKNFTGEIIYDCPKCYFRPEVAQALSKVQEELEKHNLGLKIWDGYRPLAAQWKLWNVLTGKYPDVTEREKYVSNPATQCGRHTRGTSVDCTIVYLETGEELEKPTEFDDFGPEAASDYEGPYLTMPAKKNRELLKTVMEKYGFKGIKGEWWHFDYQGWESCEPLDVPLSDLP